MEETVNEDPRVPDPSVEESSNGQQENGTSSTLPTYCDTNEDDDNGLNPSALYGKHRWKIEKFSEIDKRELRSSVFEAGGYKWYILMYPQGCDVCNYLSLFLSVANREKLFPDTLHRFWKKEHDWGWKKYMELPNLKEGFIDDSTSLTIDTQVQVIRERVDRPFHYLDFAYRRELLRVYLSNVEQICLRFVDERRTKLGKLIEDKPRWTSFGVFWLGMDQNSKRRISREKMDVILKGVVKHFFLEKEVTSTLVMESIYSGLKALEGQTKNKKDAKELSAPIVSVDKDMFVLVDDVLILLERAALEPLPPKDEKVSQYRTKYGNYGEEGNVERDERCLTELGRRTLEIYVLTHIFSNKIEVAYQEAIAFKRQEELIREEEEAAAADREKKSK